MLIPFKAVVWNNKTGDHTDTTEYLELFLRNLLLVEHNELHNRAMHIRYQKQDIDVPPSHLQLQVSALKKAFPNNRIFGRSDVIEVLSLPASAASAILIKILAAGVITAVKGKGKGRYVFC